MAGETDAEYYRQRAQQQLELAHAAPEAFIKRIHLNLASRYATQAERLTRNGATRLHDDPDVSHASDG